MPTTVPEHINQLFKVIINELEAQCAKSHETQTCHAGGTGGTPPDPPCSSCGTPDPSCASLWPLLHHASPAQAPHEPRLAVQAMSPGL